jgi:hypothetical protein
MSPGLAVALAGAAGPPLPAGNLVLCAVDIDCTFYDAQQTELASAMFLVDTPLYRGSSGTGGLMQCLGPGQIGMAAHDTVLANVDTSTIAAVSYDFGAVNVTDAVATSDLQVTGVTTSDDGFGGTQFTGKLINHASTAVTNPSVVFYTVNAAGRPLEQTEAIELTSIAAGSSWTFTTLVSVTGAYDHYVTFPDASD